MTGYTAHWQSEVGAAWKSILDRVARVTAKLGRAWRAQVTREHWDAPKFDLRWYSDDGIGRALQVFIEGGPEDYKLIISGSAWKDLETRTERWWRTQEIEAIPLPRGLNRLSLQKLENALCSAREAVSNWKESDLSERAELPAADTRRVPGAVGRRLLRRRPPADRGDTLAANTHLEGGANFSPELTAYWAAHGTQIQARNPGKYLVLVSLRSGLQAQYYSDREEALVRAKKLGSAAFFIPLPAS